MSKLKKIIELSKVWIRNNKLETLLVVLLILLASFLRLYNIRNTVVFLGDEGRDALAVKEIVLDLNPTLLGPTASVGGFYLGPIYYYMIAPFMILFAMDPTGAAVMVAVLGILTVALLYIFLRKAYGIFPALIPSLLYAVSPGVTRFSRSSWNPNPIPFFTLVTLISLYMGIKHSRLRWFVLVGLFLGILIQLHYLGLIICGAIGLMTLLLVKPGKWIKVLASELLGFLVGSSMYLAFELRHNFLNIRAVLEFITRKGGATGPRNLNFPWLFYEANRFNIEAVLGGWSKMISHPITLILLCSVALALAITWKKKHLFRLETKIIFIYWLIAVLGMSLYKGQLYHHYFELLFITPYMLTAFVLSKVENNSAKIMLSGFTGMASLFLVLRAPAWEEGSKLIDQTERISNQVIELSEGKPYNFALITEGNSDHAYRFFLEINKAEPTLLEDKVTEQLLIVCEKWPEENCAPLGNPLWEIAGFGRSEIVDQVEVYPNTTIYRMEHHAESIDMIGEPARK